MSIYSIAKDLIAAQEATNERRAALWRFMDAEARHAGVCGRDWKEAQAADVAMRWAWMELETLERKAGADVGWSAHVRGVWKSCGGRGVGEARRIVEALNALGVDREAVGLKEARRLVVVYEDRARLRRVVGAGDDSKAAARRRAM